MYDNRMEDNMPFLFNYIVLSKFKTRPMATVIILFKCNKQEGIHVHLL